MARRLILDTGVLVHRERGGESSGLDFESTDDVSIAAITYAELLVGVELAEAGQRAARADYVEAVRATLPLIDYDPHIAVAHARLLAHVHRSGRRRGAHDMIIAATAIATRRTLVTFDRSARFSELPDIDVFEL